MATYTDNYNLIKPTYAETADIVPLNNNFEKIDEVMHASQTSLAPAYDQTASYQPGDVVMYELNMYKCTGATSGVWDPSKWTRTTAAETGGGGSVDFDIFGEGSGSVVTITDGAEASLVECEIGIEPTQDLHGYSKPWAGGAGKNKAEGRYQWNINASGGILTRPEYATCVIAVTQDQTYTFSVDGVATIIDVIAFYTTYPTIGSQSYNSTRTTGANATFTAPITGYAVIRKDYDIGNMQVEEGSQATAYEPYSNICPISGHTDVTITVVSTSGGSGDDTTVSLGRTVYGGTLDVTRGVLTVTHAIVNLGSLSWTRTTDYTNPIFYAQITDKMNSSIDSICEWYANGGLITGPTTINALQNGYFGCGNNSKYIYVRDDQYTSVSDFTSATASVKFYYELATPQTFNLTPTQVETLLGQNYVSHDGGGTISLVYVKGDAPIKPNPTNAEIPLTGLEINGEKFKIESGGYQIDTLLNETNGVTVGVTYGFLDGHTLSEYDEIELIIATRENVSGNLGYDRWVMSVQGLLDFPVINYGAYEQRWFHATFTNNSFIQNNTSGDQYPYVYRIYGIKH